MSQSLENFGLLSLSEVEGEVYMQLWVIRVLTNSKYLEDLNRVPQVKLLFFEFKSNNKNTGILRFNII